MKVVQLCRVFHAQASPDLGIIADSQACGSVLLLLALLFRSANLPEFIDQMSQLYYIIDTSTYGRCPRTDLRSAFKRVIEEVRVGDGAQTRDSLLGRQNVTRSPLACCRMAPGAHLALTYAICASLT